jgi:glycosyltransferase involved in cell wall biosynthesis
MKIATTYVIFNEEDYIAASISSIYKHTDKIFVVFGLPWNGDLSIPRDRTREIITSLPDPDKKIVIRDTQARSEAEQRNIALNLVKEFGADYLWLVDGDEVYEDAGIAKLKQQILENPNADCYRSYWYTYWRSIYYRIDPPEGHTPIFTRIQPNLYWNCMRDPAGIANNYVFKDHLLHHYSYAKSPIKIKQKVTTFSHSHQILPGWYENKFLAWENNKEMRDIHPVWPTQYQKAVKISREQLPATMQDHPFAAVEVLQ